MDAVRELEQGRIPTPDGTHLCVYRLGDGEATVLLPNAVYLLEHFAHLARDYTLIAYDLRNRGRSDTVTDRALLHRGVHHDVDDLETVRAYFNVDRAHLIGHAYLAVAVAVYAMDNPARVRRIIQIGATSPSPTRQYPPHLVASDLAAIAGSDKAVRLQALREQGAAAAEPRRFCEAWWDFMREVYVVDPERAAELGDHFCEFDNEWPVNLERHMAGNIHPSLQRLDLADPELARVEAPVLVIHGCRDRNAPLGGGREWALRLPDARLLTIENAAHMPFIEAPDVVLPAVAEFLAGDWPPGAQPVTEL